MEDRLRTLLDDVTRSGRELSPSELEYIESRLAAQAERPLVETEARPLWDFIRRGFAVTIYASRPDEVYPRESLDVLVRAMSDSTRANPSVPGLLATRVTRARLVAAIADHLTHEDFEVRRLAIRLAGHCKLLECGARIAELLPEQDSTKMRMICCEALGRMGYEETAESVGPYLDSEANDLWFDARAAMLLAGGQVTPQFLRGILEHGTDTHAMLVRFRESLVSVAAQAELEPGCFSRVLENRRYGVQLCEAVAALAVASRNPELLEELLEHEQPDMRAATAMAVADAGATWAAPVLARALSSESSKPGRRSLVAALGRVGPNPEAFIRERLASDEVDDQIGAVWATLGDARYGEDLEALAHHENDDLRTAVACSLSVLSEEAGAEARREYYWSRLQSGEWWDHAIPRRLAGQAGVALPPSFSWFCSLSGPWTISDLEDAAAFVRDHPQAAFGQMSYGVRQATRRRLIACHGLADTITSRGHLEHRLLASNDAQEIWHVYLELECCGGPTTLPGRLMAKSLASRDMMELDDDELDAALVMARAGAVDTRLSFIRALSRLGARVEPFLLALLDDRDPRIADAGVAAVAELEDPRDEYLQVVRAVVGNDASISIDDALPRLLASASPALRTALIERLNVRDHARPLWILAADRDEAVARAAGLALGERPPARPIVLLRLGTESRAGRIVDDKIADRARGGAVLLAPGGYDFDPVFAKTAVHKHSDIPDDVETALCDGGRAFIVANLRAFARLFGTEGGSVKFHIGFTNVSVEVLRESIEAVGDEAVDADKLLDG